MRRLARIAAVGVLLCGAAEAVRGDPPLSSAQAQAQAASCVADSERAANAFATVMSRLDGIAKRVEVIPGQIDALRKELEAAIRDIRSGLYCTACSRTATELRKAGIDPDAHFRQNSEGGVGHPLPYAEREEKIEGKKREYEEKIRGLEREEGELRSRIASGRSELFAHQKSVRDAVACYSMAVSSAELLRQSEEIARKVQEQLLQDRLRRAREQLEQATNAAMRESLTEAIRLIEAQIQGIRDARAREAAGLEQQNQGSVAALRDAWQRTGIGEPFPFDTNPLVGGVGLNGATGIPAPPPPTADPFARAGADLLRRAKDDRAKAGATDPEPSPVRSALDRARRRMKDLLDPVKDTALFKAFDELNEEESPSVRGWAKRIVSSALKDKIVESLERRLAALQGDDTPEGRARIASTRRAIEAIRLHNAEQLNAILDEDVNKPMDGILGGLEDEGHER